MSQDTPPPPNSPKDESSEETPVGNTEKTEINAGQDAARKAIDMNKLPEQLKGLKSPHLPRPGSCSYLMLDLATIENELQDEERLKKLLAEIGLVLDAKEYYVVIENNYLLILSSAERGGNSLLATSRSIAKAIPEARISLGKTIVEYPEPNNFKLPKISVPEMQNADIYLTNELACLMQDPDSREGSHCDITTEGTDISGFVKLTEYRPRVSLVRGGPDRLIGYEKPLAKLSTLLRDDETKLITIQGEAGIGKSRLLATALKELPSAIICALDAADKNVPGASLVTVAEQLASTLDSDPMIGEEESKLQSFSKKSRPEKIEFAQGDPRQLTEMCIEALKIVNFLKGELPPLILEDLHHADRFSEEWLIRMTSDYLMETRAKAVFSMRPEEMYKSTAQKNIEKFMEGHFGKKAVKTVALEGLNFNEENISHDFAYYSLPQDIRKNRSIGPWHIDLGKAAGHLPLAMKTFMDTIKEKPGNLQITDEAIIIKQKILDRIKEIKTTEDLGIYYCEKIEKLDEEAKTMLQCMALAGGKLTGHQMSQVFEKILGISIGKFLVISNQMIGGGYIIKSPDKEGTWQLQHEFVKEFIINSIRDNEKRLSLSNFLYTIFSEDPNMSADTKFALLHDITTHNEQLEETDTIWKSYLNSANESFRDAESHNAIGRMYSIAEAILNKDKGPKMIQEAIQALQDGEEVSTDIQILTIQALFKKAESAIYLGRFQEVEDSITILEGIHHQNPDIIDISRVNLIAFEKAYIQRDRRSMEIIYNENIKDIKETPQAKKIIAEIKLAYRSNHFDKAINIYKENEELLKQLNEEHMASHKNMPHPEFAEACRLAKVRCPFEKIRNSVIQREEGKRFDEDVMLQKLATPPNQKKEELSEILDVLDQLFFIIKEYPLVFSPYAEISLREISAQIDALGDSHDTAINMLGEAWRQAMQMEVYPEATRYAKIKGDIQIVKGLLSKDPAKTQESILKGIQTYSEEGMIALANIDEKNSYNVAMRIQRIRSIGILASSGASKDQLEPHIQKAFKDFAYINQNWTHAFQDARPEVSYYLMGYMGQIIEAAKKLEIEVPSNLYDKEKYPLMDASVVAEGLSYSAPMTDNNFGEVRRKIKGLSSLMSGLKI